MSREASSGQGDAPVQVVTVTLNPAIDQTIRIPRFRAGAVNRVEQSRADAGGKGVNVASALADCGVSVAVTGFLGSENDAVFRSLFSEKRIGDRFIRIAGSTRTGIKIVDPETRETTDINFPGLAPDQREVEALFATVEALADRCEWFVLAGSVPKGMPAAIYRDLVQALKRRGRRVALDTSGEPLRLAIAGGPDFVKPNVVELGELLGRTLEGEAAILQAARGLSAEHDIACVVVSMGEQGAICVKGSEAVLAVPAHVEVMSTVGAGDAMVAGFLAGALRGLPLAECARLGTACSMGAISTGGSGLPAQSEIERLMSQVTIRQLGPGAVEGGHMEVSQTSTPR
jgi:1-phosphofructokinase